MDEEQAYLFDLDGYIVLRGVVGEGTVRRLMASNRKRGEGADGRSSGERYRMEEAELARRGNGSGAARPRMSNDQSALHWDKSYRDIMAIPDICSILEQLCGRNFRLDHVNVHARDGTFGGGRLHGGSNPGGGNGFFFHKSGGFQNGLVSVTFELEDTYCNGGGFCCIPGEWGAPVRIVVIYNI
jgi:hypothetical protein